MSKCVIDYINIDVLEIVCVISNDSTMLTGVSKIRTKMKDYYRRKRILKKCTIVKYHSNISSLHYTLFNYIRLYDIFYICGDEHCRTSIGDKLLPSYVTINERAYSQSCAIDYIEIIQCNVESFVEDKTKHYTDVMDGGRLISVSNNGTMIFENDMNNKFIYIGINGRYIKNDGYHIFENI